MGALYALLWFGSLDYRQKDANELLIRETPAFLPGELEHEAERALVLRLLQFDTAVWDTLDKYSPHRLCTYLFELASEFSSFYEHCPVMRADSEEQKMSRLALCDFTARVMEQGLALLGIESPEQM